MIGKAEDSCGRYEQALIVILMFLGEKLREHITRWLVRSE